MKSTKSVPGRGAVSILRTFPCPLGGEVSVNICIDWGLRCPLHDNLYMVICVYDCSDGVNMKMIFCLPIKGRIYSIGKEGEELRGRSGDTWSNTVLSFRGVEKGISNALELFFCGTSRCNSMPKDNDNVISSSGALL